MTLPTTLYLLCVTAAPSSNVGLYPSPQLAAAMCADDAAQVNGFAPGRLPLYRYLQLPDRAPATAVGVALGVNLACNRCATLHRPAIVGGGWVMRVDLSQLVDQPEELVNLVDQWDRLRFIEPYFHVQVQQRVEVPRGFVHTDGKRYTARMVKVTEHALHADPGSLLLLETLCQTKNPLMRADFFLSKALKTAGDGRYYDFRGTRGITFDQWLQRHGVDLTKYKRQDGQNRGAIAVSLITGKVRWYEVLMGGTTVRPVNGIGWVMVTHDITNDDATAETDVFKNLVNPKDKARECFSVEESGLPEMFLSDGNGVQQDFVPGNVAGDRTVPPPHTPELQGMISCARCHGGDEFYKMLNNDAARITPRFVVELGDRRTLDEQRALILGMYGIKQGALDGTVRLARNSLNDLLVRSFGQAFDRPERAVIESMSAMTTVYDRYEYDLVTPRVALTECGVPVQRDMSDDRVVELLNKLMPDLPVNAGGLQPEGAHEALLKADVGVGRRLWECAFSDVALRVRTTITVTGPSQAQETER